MAKPLTLAAAAKINLSIDVLGRREDGYHQVEMVMQTIELCDQVILEPGETGVIRVHCSHPHVPSGRENLVWKAANLLRQKYGSPELGADIAIVKNIPVAAGLAGGSTDAAATLKGLNQLWKLNLPHSELAKLGAELGADIPFCLMGGTALARGIGEELTPLPSPPKLWVTLLKPNLGISTAEVYRHYVGSRVQRRPDTRALIAALHAADSRAMANSMANVLESVTFARLPLLRRLKQRAMEFGALVAQMSGSGPTIYALTEDYRRAAAIANGLRHQVEFTHITSFKEG
ncbi:MAG: 4-(cytidine 5'-diphospho)-2-C-methyl-D-erythritol kinase [Bacillota bacterium]